MLNFYKQFYEDVKTSYKIKYAVEDTLSFIRPDDINISLIIFHLIEM